MFRLFLCFIAHFRISQGNVCNVANNEPVLPLTDNHDFCLFSNYSKFKSATAGYAENTVEINLNFNVQNTQVDQDLNLWDAKVLLGLAWPDHRILLRVCKQISNFEKSSKYQSNFCLYLYLAMPQYTHVI